MPDSITNSSMETRVAALVRAAGTRVKTILENIGDLTTLSTTEKTSLVGALNELKVAIDSSSTISDTTTALTSTWSSSKISSTISTAISNLVNSAPSALDTLNELAAALGNDANFATTVTNQIASKANDSDVVKLTGNQTIAGTKTFSNSVILTTGDNGITGNTNDSYVEITGALSSSNGAWLDLHGKDDGNGGSFRLGACNGTNTVRLVGSADGSLTWGGNDVVLTTGAQTISGAKTFTSSLIVRPGGNSITTTENNSHIEICSGTDNTHGAFLEMYGDGSASNAGAFRIGASDGTNTKRLIGLPDGSLTWDGNPVVIDHNGYSVNGSIYCANPSDPDEDSTMVATTSWVQDLVQNSGPVIDNGRREVWSVTTASASGATITLPNSMSYVVGDNRLFLSVNGAVLLPTYNYTEVGNDGETSTSVSMLMPLSVGDEIMAWTVPVCIGGSALNSLVSRIAALENTIAGS